MKTLYVNVVDKVATYVKRCGAIVCGNSDYRIQFSFDDEWNAHTKKTARFVWNGQYFDVEFVGNVCPVPIIQNADNMFVGVYAGDLETTTSAKIECLRSILCQGGTPHIENDRSYANEAKEAANSAKLSAEEARAAAEEAQVGSGLKLIGTVYQNVGLDSNGDACLFGQKIPKQDGNGLMTFSLPDEIRPYLDRAKLMYVECYNSDAAWLDYACREFVPVSLCKKNTHAVSFSAETDSWGDPWQDEGGDPLATIKRYMYLKSMRNTLFGGHDTYPEWLTSGLKIDFYA